jgi:acyl carrier protein
VKDVREYVIEYISRKRKLPDDPDVDSIDFLQTGLLDSMDVYKFFIILEQEFNIEISDEEIASYKYTTIGSITSLIRSKLRES